MPPETAGEEEQRNMFKRSLKKSTPSSKPQHYQSVEHLEAVEPPDCRIHPQDKEKSSCRPSPLLRLPSEIRLKILRYVLPSNPLKRFRLYSDCDSTTVVIGTRHYSRRLNTQRRTPDNSALAVLRTNKLIYTEALSVLYSENLFHFVGVNYVPVLDFVRRLGPEPRSMVRKVRLTLLRDGGEISGSERPMKSHDNFCAVVHDYLPGLNSLQADSWVLI